MLTKNKFLATVANEELAIPYGLAGVPAGVVGVAAGVAGVAGATGVAGVVGVAGVSVACSPQAAKVKAKPSPKATVKNFFFIHSSLS
ncbi:hypothetical protein ACE1B6_18725 [Aerosakkonemataceae cyanobacterium BLCC-F154]|uniref:Uncharacterized protein n=1 Tax=Floridaenema fluviatile BLCC-F154 TaxID=3153640 RepID=A0ABV4YEV4_9CYAN